MFSLFCLFIFLSGVLTIGEMLRNRRFIALAIFGFFFIFWFIHNGISRLNFPNSGAIARSRYLTIRVIISIFRSSRSDISISFNNRDRISLKLLFFFAFKNNVFIRELNIDEYRFIRFPILLLFLLRIELIFIQLFLVLKGRYVRVFLLLGYLVDFL